MDKVYRKVPDDTIREFRENRLKEHINATTSIKLIPRLEHGNKKTGQSSRDIAHVYVWNLPAVSTCPGASAWCKSVCYNGDDKSVEVMNRSLWTANEQYSRNKVEELKSIIINQLKNKYKETTLKIIVRVHSSGDFFSKEYISMWIDIVKYFPDIYFWAYTRSWTEKSLLNSLEVLRKQKNFQLFASVDPTMVNPPTDWRISRVKDPKFPSTSDVNLIDSFACPEEINKKVNCAICQHCFKKDKGDVMFNVH